MTYACFTAKIRHQTHVTKVIIFGFNARRSGSIIASISQIGYNRAKLK